MPDRSYQLRSVQTIAADGTKRFLKGGRKKGCYFSFGGPVTTSLAICEGYATGATIHEASRAPVAIAFDAGNLEPVAIAFGNAMQAASQQATEAMNLLLGDLSPLNDQQKWQKALGGLRAAPSDPKTQNRAVRARFT